MATKKVAKKVVAPKPAKVAKAAKKKVTLPSQQGSWTPPVTFKSFSVRAVIPVQQYSNIQPEITVEAMTYEQARDFVMPLIEDLFRQYSESKPAFLGKVTETVKVVTPPAQQDTTFNPTANAVASSATAPAPVASNESNAVTSTPANAAQKSEAVVKAEKKISLAMSDDAVQLIQDQIQQSVKIAPEDKPALITLCLHKRNEFKGK